MTLLTDEDQLIAAAASSTVTTSPATDEVDARLAGAATGALRRVLDGHGFTDVGAAAVVHRSPRHLRVVLLPGVAVPRRLLAMASVRAVTAVRAVDPDVASIGVGAQPVA